MTRVLFLCLIVLIGSIAPLPADEKKAEELNWDNLIPPDFNPGKLLEEYNVEEMDDSDPRAAELMKKMKEVWKAAPVVESLEGRLIKLPGFVVPLETDKELVTEFFLVPYYGACIHVPPPPANQMVYVVMQEGKGLKGSMFDAVWVTGTLTVKNTSNELGDAGYMMYGTQTEPYK